MGTTSYILLALVAGVLWGSALGYLLNAPRRKVSESRQWLVTIGVIMLVMTCAVVMRNLGDLSALSVPVKWASAAAFVIGFGPALWRCRVKF